MKWGSAEILSLTLFLLPSYESYFCSFSYRCHLPLFGYSNGFHGVDNRTKDCAFCLSTYTVEGSAECRGAESQGRALIDFLSQTAERCMQDWAPGETCPATCISLALTSHCGVGKIRECLERAKRSLLLPSHTQTLPLPSILLNCNNENKNVEKNLQMGLCFSKSCVLGEKNFKALNQGWWWKAWGGVLEQQGQCLPSALPSPPTAAGSSPAPRAFLRRWGRSLVGGQVGVLLEESLSSIWSIFAPAKRWRKKSTSPAELLWRLPFLLQLRRGCCLMSFFWF